ncbi:BirA family transcriptional regulator, biotin operon repressor / biotin-[acetyl-CoA-carboxylase] ligase [Nitrosospira multiformis]|uniref:Bifunctional ligase/repressor BirA n=1 Tax=Nitrosospira multiformis TaxID=1231 RepID=A0A1H8FAA9_9PROT|nr:biotin--[acetyl-CoA-carboxylase] ligase [Nitrosospira multiformis]SEN28394.1 BirA family transcriptional regulator, biotin operon repressor / biotin-[acetyl-CoA-carboxylase] ligase [Nitrosospira multiformis]
MNPLTFSILRLLSDNEFHSGPAIAEALGVSRASVSNALRDADETGLTIHKIKGRGYRLLDQVQWLERSAILEHLGHQADKFNLEILDTIDSTNSLLLHEADNRLSLGDRLIHVIAAELQTKGRGRRGRQWHSGLGVGLAFSVLWRFQQSASFLSGLSLAIGVAIVRALESSGIRGAVLKWPNDVMFNFCKLAGILIELHGDMLGPTVAVIGVGMNLKLSDSVQARIDQGATDIFSISGEIPDRNKLLAELLLNIARVLREFEQSGFTPFKEEWVDRHVCEGKAVTLKLPDGSGQEGRVHGVSDNGSLLLQTSLGLRSFSGGEISLRRTA